MFEDGSDVRRPLTSPGSVAELAKVSDAIASPLAEFPSAVAAAAVVPSPESRPATNWSSSRSRPAAERAASTALVGIGRRLTGFILGPTRPWFTLADAIALALAPALD